MTLSDRKHHSSVTSRCKGNFRRLMLQLTQLIRFQLTIRTGFWPTVLSVEPLVYCVVCLSVVCDVLYCGKTVRPSEKLSEGVNKKPGWKSWFFGSLPYFYFRFGCYGHRDNRFANFACTAQQLVLDGTNWLSSSKPCAYCRIVWSELKPEVV